MNTISLEKALAALVGIVAAAIVAYLPELQDAQTELINLITAVTLVVLTGFSLDRIVALIDRYIAFAAKTPSKKDDDLAAKLQVVRDVLVGLGAIGVMTQVENAANHAGIEQELGGK